MNIQEELDDLKAMIQTVEAIGEPDKYITVKASFARLLVEKYEEPVYDLRDGTESV